MRVRTFDTIEELRAALVATHQINCKRHERRRLLAHGRRTHGFPIENAQVTAERNSQLVERKSVRRSFLTFLFAS
jgi:hypothetical protein